MLCLSGFELYSRWVPLPIDACVAQKRLCLSSDETLLRQS